MVRYAILGPVELRDGGRGVVVGGPRQVALLALLLVNANRALSNDRLIDTLWGDLGPAGALKRLQAAILRLRRALDPEGGSGESVLRTVAGGYLLAVCPGELDAEVFQVRVQEGRRVLLAGEAQRAREVLVEALGMWRGPALADVAYDEFAQPEIRRLEELRLAALEARVDCELRLGEHGGVIGELEALVAAHPGRERLAAQLMLAMYRCGRQGDALEVYARTRAYLSGELGLEPGPALQALQREILEQSATLVAPVDRRAAELRSGRSLPRALRAARRKEGDPVRRPEAGAAIFNVPITTRTFVGRRQQLQRLEEGLSGDGAVAITQVHAIHGMGGVGKTQLAARYAREHRDDYDVIWWLRAEQPETLRADLAGLAVALGLVDAEGDEGAISAARGWLEHNGRWLLVFDNATGPDAIAGLLPEGTGGHVVITSRAHADWGALHVQPLALDVWRRAESSEFLRGRTGEQDIAVVDAAAEALGDLPLALEQAAAYTNTKAITLTGYMQRLRDRAPQLFSTGRPAGYEHTVATVWQLAFEQIAEHRAAHTLLEVCGHLAPERIPRELLEAALDYNVISDVSSQAADDAIELLLAYALLTPTGEQTFAMHRLIGQLTRAGADAAAQAAAAAVAVTALDVLWPDVPPWHHEQWPACERLRAHTLAATEHSERHGAAPEQTARVLLRIGQYQAERAQLTSGRQLIQRALVIFETVYGPKHPDLVVTLGSLGIVLQRLGELAEAHVALQRALAICEAVFGSDHPAVAISLSFLGFVQQQRGELEAARITLQRALAIGEAVNRPEGAQVAHTHDDPGVVHQHVGEGEAAGVVLERALEIFKTVDRPEGAAAARTLGILGDVQRELGELEAARVTLQRALETKEALYGPGHPEVANTLTNLGKVQRELGELEVARVTLQRALETKEAVYGLEHPHVASTLTSLASVQRKLGEHDQARAVLQRAVAIFESFLGPDHADTVEARSTLKSMDSSANQGV
jgi:DNA-binding SARP family transcriptional activator